MVGAAGFEPTTSCPPDKRATKLRHAPTKAGTIDGYPAAGNQSLPDGGGFPAATMAHSSAKASNAVTIS